MELYNHSNSSNDLSGCVLTDNLATNKFILAPGTAAAGPLPGRDAAAPGPPA